MDEYKIKLKKILFFNYNKNAYILIYSIVNKTINIKKIFKATLYLVNLNLSSINFFNQGNRLSNSKYVMALLPNNKVPIEKRDKIIKTIPNMLAKFNISSTDKVLK